MRRPKIREVFGGVHIPWLINSVRLASRELVVYFLLALVFLLGASLPSTINAVAGKPDTLAELVSAFSASFSQSKPVEFFVWFAAFFDLRGLLTATALVIFVRIFQHSIDYSDWHTPWAQAHLDRVSAPLGFPGPRDFPCMIVGIGGSGKSTLAQTLERTFLSRRRIKIRSGGDIGEERETVSRGAEGQGVGGRLKPYSVTWAPGRYKIGRLAEAYDLPGQITEDWSSAFIDLTNCAHGRARRVVILHVVSNGFNANIQKFKPSEPPERKEFDYAEWVSCGKILVLPKDGAGKPPSDGKDPEATQEYLYQILLTQTHFGFPSSSNADSLSANEGGRHGTTGDCFAGRF
jgi:hypothetical protein